MDNSSHTSITVNGALHPDSPTCGIQEALDSLPKHGGVVMVPAGTYVVRCSIRLKCNVTLRGEGPATVLTRPAPVLFDVVIPAPAHRMEAGLSTVQGLVPGDEIWIRDTMQSGWHSRHMQLRSIQGQQAEGILIAGPPERAYEPEAGAWGGNFFPMVVILGGMNVTIESLAVDGGEHAYNAGRVPDFTCSAIHGVKVDNLCVRHVSVRRWPGDGISAQGGTATVTHCLVEDGLGNGFHPGTSIQSGLWTHNVARRNRWDGFYFCLNVRNTVVAHNLFLDNRRHGIGGLSAPDGYNVITGNVIARNGRRGIEAPQALGNVISQNLVQDNSQAAPGMFPGIWLEDHSGNVVTGNSCIDTQEPHTQTIGIEAEHPVGDNLLSGNFAPVYPSASAWSPPRGALRRTTSAPGLSGRMDDAAWKVADRLAVNRDIEDGTPLPLPTEACVLYDDTSLYIGVRCPEPLMARMRDRIRTRGGDSWRENSVQIFIAPPDPDAPCFQFVVNSLAAVFETRPSGRDGKPWDSKGTAVCYRGKEFWSVEIAIPIASLDRKPLKPGQELTLNICRSRVTAFPPELTAWSPTFGAFGRVRGFGTLVVA